jgi:hypothetical protein
MKTNSLTSALVLLIAVTNAEANLVINGSFETPDIFSSNQGTGSTAITGWTVVGGQVQWNDGVSLRGGQLASDGRQFVNLTGRAGYGHGLETVVPTVAGQVYTLSFDLGAAYPALGAALALSIDGWESVIYSNLYSTPGIPGQTVDWETKTVTFTADGTDTLFDFIGWDAGYTQSYYFIGLDNVDLHAVESAAAPNAVGEPSMSALLLASVGALILATTHWGRRRRFLGRPTAQGLRSRAAATSAAQ